MTRPDPVLARLSEGIGLRRQGRHAEAGALLEHLWGDARAGPAVRCVIAHSLADAQDDVHSELRWDLAALDAAHAATDDEVAAVGMGDSASALFPSLYLNLAECYRRTGDVGRAREHLEHGLRTTPALPAGEYADTVRAGLTDLAERLGRRGTPTPHERATPGTASGG